MLIYTKKSNLEEKYSTENRCIINNETLEFQKNQYYNIKGIIKRFHPIKITIFNFLCLCLFCLNFYKKENKNNYSTNYSELINLDKYEVSRYNLIKNKLIGTNCSQMANWEREFINGIIRKFKPKKILEVGVYHGGSSIVILNAINDIRNSKLFSIDLYSDKFVGDCVNKYFPYYERNWKLFKGNIATEFIEKIGKNIDVALFDTVHFEPGEILDFLMVLPFLNEEAIVIFHDIGAQYFSMTRQEWAPYIIFNGIRGTKFYPSGNYILKHNIGAIKLEKNQSKYYQDYFRLLGGLWQYFPKEIHINLLKNFFVKYYGKKCLTIFEETISFNRYFVKQNPKSINYRKISD